jgi:cytochrome c oxidase subunit 3
LGLGGSGANGDDHGGNGHGPTPKPDLPLAKIGFWLLIGSLSTMFGALATAYGYRMSEKANYAFPWPPSLWISTLAIVVSSATLYIAQRKVAEGRMRSGVNLLGVTVALGWAFVLSQIVSWLLLARAGFYAQTNPFAGLFYILTSVHGFHLLAGVAWLIYLFYLAKLGIMTSKKHLALDLGAIYWHFMMIVWLVFFALIVL